MSESNVKIDINDMVIEGDGKAIEKSLPFCYPVEDYISKHLAIIVFISSSMIPITAAIIYIRYRGDLDKCDISFKIWMLLIIIIVPILIIGTIVEKYCNSDDEEHVYIMHLCSIILTILLYAMAFALLLSFNNVNTCRKISPHVYNFILSVLFILPGIVVIGILMYIFN